MKPNGANSLSYVKSRVALGEADLWAGVDLPSFEGIELLGRISTTTIGILVLVLLISLVIVG